MNVQDIQNRSLFGRSAKRSFDLNLDAYHFVLDRKFKLVVDQDLPPVPVSSELRNGYLLIGEDDGHIDLINCQRMYSVCRFKAHNNSIFVTKFRPNYDKQILTASGDRSICIWDFEQEKSLIKIDRGYSCSIKTLDFYDSNVFVSGGRDGFIRLWDLRTDKKEILAIKDAHRNNLKSTKKQSKRSTASKSVVSDPNSVVTAIIFGQHNYLYSAGANDGSIKIWDLRCLNSTSYNHLIYLQKLDYCGSNEKAEGFTDLVLDSKNQLYASCTDHKIYSYNYKGSVGIKCESEYVKSFKGASITNYTHINILNDDLLICGSSLAEVCVWSLKKARNNYQNYPQVKLPHGIDEVSVITCDDSKYEIFTCDDSTNLYKWKVNPKLHDSVPKVGEVSSPCDEIIDEKIDLGKRRRILSPKNSLLNLHHMTSGVKRPFPFLMRAQ